MGKLDNPSWKSWLGSSGSHITQKASPLGDLFLWESCQGYGTHVTVWAEPQEVSPCCSRPASEGSNMAGYEKPLVSHDLQQEAQRPGAKICSHLQIMSHKSLRAVNGERSSFQPPSQKPVRPDEFLQEHLQFQKTYACGYGLLLEWPGENHPRMLSSFPFLTCILIGCL